MTHELESPASSGTFVLICNGVASSGLRGVKLGTAIAQFDGYGSPSMLNFNLELLLSITSQRMIDNVASAFFQSQGQAEDFPLSKLLLPAKPLECFHRAHDFFRCSVQFQNHERFSFRKALSEWFPTLRESMAISSDCAAEPANARTL